MKKTKSTKPATVSEVAKAFIKSRRFEGMSQAYIRAVKIYMKIFIDYFGETPLIEVTPEKAMASAFRHWSPTTRDNYIRILKTFASWARDNDFIPYDRRTFAERIKKVKIILDEPEFFTTEEMRRLLSVASMLVGGDEEFLIPVLVLGGFVGMRASEICRVRWEDIDLAHKAIRLGPRVTKTGRRRIAIIPDNAVAWLKHVEKKIGFVVPQHIVQNLNRYTGMMATESGVEWKNNALRHSYVTYAMAQERDAWKVSEQVGNSPRVLQAHYKGLVLASDAVEWFNITPDNTL
jgi:hypothetical protein